MAHSLFSPSGAHRWAGCPGSIVLAGTEPEETGSSASREGTFLHEVMQKHVQHSVPFDRFPLDDEQRAVVTACAEYVESLPRDYALFETRVNFGKMLMQPEEDTFGTADLVLVKGDTCRIIDYKFGRRYVDPQENLQGILYIFGMVETMLMMDETIRTYEFEIIQPRAGGNSVSNGVWTVDAKDIPPYITKMRMAANRVRHAMSDANWRDDDDYAKWCDTYLDVSEKACEFCRAAHKCPAMRHVAEADVSSVMTPQGALAEEFPVMLANDDLAHRLSRVSVLKNYIEAIENEAMTRALAREDIPGFRLVKGRAGNRDWTDTEEAERRLSSLGYDPVQFKAPAKLLTPAQVENRLVGMDMGKKDAKALVDSLTSRGQPKPALVPVEKGGTPWDFNDDVAKEFAIL